MNDVKQVICMRTDLNMRKGKMVAQGSHASLGAVILIWNDLDAGMVDFDQRAIDAYDEWLGGTFTKICVGVDDETELMRVYSAATQAKLPVKLITDAGHTEFRGVPTRTCLAIGPCWSEDVDKITGGLKLL